METADTALTRRRYDRIAPVYDALEWAVEPRFARWRRALWERVPPGRVLEVGVGTGKNLRYYPAGAEVTAIDISPGMLAQARRRAARLGSSAALHLGDVQHLDFPDGSFDAVVASFTFCSVPDPVRGLAEIRRVLRPGGRLLLLEHVLSMGVMLRPLMRLMSPLPFYIWGARIDRETVINVHRAGFESVEVQNLLLDIVVMIDASPRLVQH